MEAQEFPFQIYVLYVQCFPVCMRFMYYMCRVSLYVCAPHALRGQEKVLDSLELESQKIVSQRVGAEN